MAIQPEVLYNCVCKDLSDGGYLISKTLPPDASVQDAFAVSILSSITKKFVSNVKDDADSKALVKFLAVNQDCENWTLSFKSTKAEILYGLVRQVLQEFWYRDGMRTLVDHPYDVLSKARLGSGSNLCAEGLSTYAKLFSSRLSCSDPYLYFWYRRYIRNFPEFSNAENIRTENFGSVKITRHSRLSFVPKNDEISRVICVEPTLNTYFQLGFAHILISRLREKFGISLHNQQYKNRELARLGSITDGLSTIDLSSASDSISIKMLEGVLPKEFLGWLMRLRTPEVAIKGRDSCKLHMISTMGNGFTFPLQTIIFASVVVACARFRDLKLDGSSSANLYGVYGDDIVCPDLITQDVIDVLTMLGFKVNDEKTFVKGPFRESCGADFFNGVNVRGVYVKRLEGPHDLYSAINRLIRFSTRSGIFFGHTYTLLAESLGKNKLYVPPFEDPSSGLHVPFSDLITRRHAATQSISYDLLVARLPKYRIGDGYIISPRGAKKLIYNPSGLFISCLQGEVNSSTFGFRDEAITYRRKRRYTSAWACNVVTDYSHLDYGLDWQRWDSAVESYLERG